MHMTYNRSTLDDLDND